MCVRRKCMIISKALQVGDKALVTNIHMPMQKAVTYAADGDALPLASGDPADACIAHQCVPRLAQAQLTDHSLHLRIEFHRSAEKRQ